MEEQDKDAIFSQDIAAEIVELFENVLDRYDIVVPSPEDDERGEDNGAKLYGSVYWDLLDSVENVLIKTLEEHAPDIKIVAGEFSATCWHTKKDHGSPHGFFTPFYPIILPLLSIVKFVFHYMSFFIFFILGESRENNFY